MYLVISFLVLRAGFGIWLYQFLIIAYLFTFDRSIRMALTNLILSCAFFQSSRILSKVLCVCHTQDWKQTNMNLNVSKKIQRAAHLWIFHKSLRWLAKCSLAKNSLFPKCCSFCELEQPEPILGSQRILWYEVLCTKTVNWCPTEVRIPLIHHMSQPMRLWYLSHRRRAKAQASLRIHAVSPEPSLFAHIKYGSRRRDLAPLDGCACAFEEWVYGGRKVPKSHELAHMLFLIEAFSQCIP